MTHMRFWCCPECEKTSFSVWIEGEYCGMVWCKLIAVKCKNCGQCYSESDIAKDFDKKNPEW